MADDVLRIRLIGGPTVLIEYGGLRLLTDPTFDAPGDYPIGERRLVKTEPPAISPDQLGRVDAVLLSHHQHPDNLDRAGRALLASVPVTFTTPASAAVLGGAATPLATWKAAEVSANGTTATITAVAARHGPPDCERLTGEVTGFMITAPDQPVVYVSGDNAALGLVSEVANRFGPIDVAVIFAGAARTALMDSFLTLTSTMAADAAQILDARLVIPAHFRGWQHFTQGPETLRAAFEAEQIADRLVLLEPGQAVEIDSAGVRQEA